MVDRTWISFFKSSFDANVIPMEADWVLAVNIKSRQIEFRFDDLQNEINDDPHLQEVSC